MTINTSERKETSSKKWDEAETPLRSMIWKGILLQPESQETEKGVVLLKKYPLASFLELYSSLYIQNNF